MRAAKVITLVVAVVLGAQGAIRHWTETEKETIWQGQYKNCDYAYAVTLPEGVVGHGSLSPSPNHGIVISAADPGTTSEVKPEDPRIVTVYSFYYDEADFGSARDYLLGHVKQSARVIESRNLKFKGFSAAYVHSRIKEGTGTVEEVELAIYRKDVDSASILYVISLKTPTEYYRQDSRFYEKIRDGFEALPPPKGSCSND